MEYIVEYIADKKIVGIKIKKRINFQIVEQYSKEAIKLAHQNECAKFLIDHSETAMEGGVKKIHASGEELQEFGFKSTDRIAIVIANQNSDSNLSNPVNQNSRWSILKYFSEKNIQDAFLWLSDTAEK